MQSVGKDTWQSEVLDSTVPVLVDFWAEWCGPCKALAPVLEEVSNDIGSRAKIVKVNIDEHPELAGQFGIRSIPTLLVFKEGQVKDQMVGLMPKPQIQAKLEAHL